MTILVTVNIFIAVTVLFVAIHPGALLKVSSWASARAYKIIAGRQVQALVYQAEESRHQAGPGARRKVDAVIQDFGAPRLVAGRRNAS